MKRCVLIILGALLCLMAQAQVRVAVKGGAVFSSMSRDVQELTYFAQEYGSRHIRRQGFAAGAAVEVPLRGRLSLQSEVLYVRKGYKIDGFWFSADTYLDCFETPLLAKLSFGGEKTWRFLIYAGMHLAYALGGRFTYDDRVLGRSGSYDIRFRSPPDNHANPANYTNINPYIGPEQGNRLEVGGVAGVAAARRWGNGEVTFDLRYGRAFTDLLENDRSRFRTVSVLAGYALPLKRR